jgi:N-acetylglucosaminyldiphosphoundecaprenol N-acetyl-beta-D-mannosaminyltransferase
MQKLARVNILGVGISAINMPMALEVIQDWLARQEANYVCVTGVHGVMESQQDETLRQIHNKAGLVTPDGMPLVWLSRWKGFARVGRVYGPDLMLALCEASVEHGFRHFLLGGAEGVPEKLADNLQGCFPGLVIAGTYSPPFRSLTPQEDAQIVDMLRQARADVIWVGLGTPKQERWMAAHHDLLPGAVLIGVGAAFDFHTGRSRQAPVWMRQNGLEWLYRLLAEPGRLWRRYLINNPLFVTLVLAQTLGLREYSLEVGQTGSASGL